MWGQPLSIEPNSEAFLATTISPKSQVRKPEVRKPEV